MPESIDVFATAYGEAPSRAIAASAAHLGYETSRDQPPDDLDVEFCDYNFRARRRLTNTYRPSSANSRSSLLPRT
jgi:hypothetical protein